MKLIKSKTLLVVLVSLMLNSCGLFSLFEEVPYSYIFIQLINKTNDKKCSLDSLAITFKVTSETSTNPKQLKMDVLPYKPQSISLEIKKNEFFNVKIYNSKDSTLIFEKRMQAGKNKYEGGDMLPKKISFCNLKDVKFENF
jgi:hypothetical protein